MADQDWAADVKKYAPDADDGVIAGIVRYCGIALRKVDSSLVSFSDPKELARVRENYCKKKLALTDSDDVINAAIADVGERMKADRTKNRVTVYYLLADRFGKLGLFAPKAKGGTRASGGAAAAGAGAAAVAATAVGAAAAAPSRAAKPKATRAKPAAAAAMPTPAPVAAPTPAPVAAPTPATEPVAAAAPMAAAGLAGTAIAATAGAAGSTAASQGSDDHHAAAATATGGNWQPQPVREPSGGFMFGTVLGVVGLIIGAALLAWFISSRMGGSTEAAPAVAAAAPAPAPAPAATPAPAPTPPEGSGVIATEVGGKPMVSVYFDTASAEVHSDFATSVAPIIAWLAAHPEDMAQVSGFNDPRGNAAFNADLSRRRAEGVAAQLRELGVPDQQIDLEPPASATDATTDLAGARRVEITVVPLS